MLTPLNLLQKLAVSSRGLPPARRREWHHRLEYRQAPANQRAPLVLGLRQPKVERVPWAIDEQHPTRAFAELLPMITLARILDECDERPPTGQSGRCGWTQIVNA